VAQGFRESTTRKEEEDDATEPNVDKEKLKKKKKKIDPYDLPEEDLIEKIKHAKKAEVSAKRKRESLEAMLESSKRFRYLDELDK